MSTVYWPGFRVIVAMVRVPQGPQSSHEYIVPPEVVGYPLNTRIHVSYPEPHELKVYEPATGA